MPTPSANPPDEPARTPTVAVAMTSVRILLLKTSAMYKPPDALTASAAGLEKVGYRSLSGGIVAIHSGWRL